MMRTPLQGDVQVEFGPEVTGQQCVLCVFLGKFCKGIFLILMHERNPTVVISTQLRWQNLPKMSLWIFRSMSSYLCILYMDLSSFGRQDKSLLFCAVATLEPVIPSLNHITKLAQRRRKNVMQAFGWESWDGDKAFPGSLNGFIPFQGEKYAFISFEGQVVKSEVKQFRFSFGCSIKNSYSRAGSGTHSHFCLFMDLSTGAQLQRLNHAITEGFGFGFGGDLTSSQLGPLLWKPEVQAKF